MVSIISSAQPPDTCLTQKQLISIAQKAKFQDQKIEVLQSLNSYYVIQLDAYKQLNKRDSLSILLRDQENSLLANELDYYYTEYYKLEKKNKSLKLGMISTFIIMTTVFLLK